MTLIPGQQLVAVFNCWAFLFCFSFSFGPCSFSCDQVIQCSSCAQMKTFSTNSCQVYIYLSISDTDIIPAGQCHHFFTRVHIILVILFIIAEKWYHPFISRPGVVCHVRRSLQ